METVSIRFVNDGALSAYSATVAHIKERASPELTIDEGVIEEMRVGPIIYIPPEVIVAGIGAISAAVSAALTYIATRKSGNVVLKGKDGRSIEIPRDLTREEVDFYIAKAKDLDVDGVTIDNGD